MANPTNGQSKWRLNKHQRCREVRTKIMLSAEIDEAFANIKSEYGLDSLLRVENMIHPAMQDRHPLQKGAKWVMPGIPKRPWHDPYEYQEIAPIARAFDSSHSSIKSELAEARAAKNSQFMNYEHYLSTQADWQALYLFRNGGPVREAAAITPTTFGILDEYVIQTGKLCTLLESHFSILLPGATIKRHCDLWNFSINLHFAVDIPAGCGICVADETREWQEGKCLLFDYSFEHEAWNRGTRPRACLLVDLWHPDTTIPERKALTVLISEIRRMLGE
jgi:aspartyl/asparaginyl beta-hydroxylase (cupin superfamily)